MEHNKNDVVSEALLTSGLLNSVPKSASGPNWGLVPFEVGCARCGHDLRGLSEPLCPACGLQFDWADAVPLEQLTCLHCGYHLFGLSETRCPECGEAFTWQEVLDDYRRRQKPIFEYRWRKEPLRSFVRTWFRAARPGKFWKMLDIHDPPQPWPLLATVGVVLIVMAMSMALLDGINSWLLMSMGFRAGRVRPPFPTADLPMYILEAFKHPMFHRILVSTLTWYLTSFLSLLVFQQSMRLCKVRTVHVLRVWAYAVPLFVPVVTAAGYGIDLLATVLHAWRLVELNFGLAIALWLFAIWSLRCGYRSYLRMRHSAAVAITSQIIALLATLIVDLLHIQLSDRLMLLA